MVKLILGYISNPKLIIKHLLIVLSLTLIISSRSLIIYAVKGVGWAFVLAYLLLPIVIEFEKREWPRFLAVMIIWIIIVCTIIISISLLIPIIFQQISLITEQWTELKAYSSINKQLLPLIPTNIQEFLFEKIQEWPAILNRILATVMSTEFMDNLTLYLVIPVLSFYMMLEREEWNLALLHLFPIKWRSDMALLGRRLNIVMGRWVRGHLLISLIVVVSTTLGIHVIGIEYALLLGVINGIANFIPYFGPLIGAVPGVFLAFTSSDTLFWPTILIYASLQIVKSMFIMPVLIGRQVYQKPAIILIALLFGGQFFGIVGLLLAVPLLVLLNILISFVGSLRVRSYI